MNSKLLPIWALALAAACSHDTPAAPAPADDRPESAASCAAEELDRIDTSTSSALGSGIGPVSSAAPRSSSAA